MATRMLAVISLLGPLTLFLPRFVVPAVRPGSYVDTWQRIMFGLVTPDGWLLLAWTTLPYGVVGWLGLTFLRRAPDPTRTLGLRWGLVGSLAAVFVLGVIVHAPQRMPGMNFGVAFFPLYAVPVALGGYLAGLAAYKATRCLPLWR
ncbi:MAG TPA: hypothetical protein VHJ77_05620 [Vicinamibacterales bacterium]|jgi:hypothetical protein|nr:hypothetical protein [Vicinamibacterales bacterium]